MKCHVRLEIETGKRRLLFYSLIASIAIILIAAMLFFAVRHHKQQAVKPPQAVEVNAVQVIQRDTPVTYTFVGQVVAKDEVPIRANVSGHIVDKMVTGGTNVQEGQPLFRIDRRQYDAALLNAKAQLAQAQATLAQASRDRYRYEQLAAQGAVARQVLDNAIAQEQQNMALVEAYRAKLAQAEDDLQDTLVVAPLSGRIDIKDLSVGSFVQAGQTVLATISSVDPVFVQFSISENEYLKFAKLGRGVSPADWFGDLTLILSDGSQYPGKGRITQVDRGLAQNTGTLTLKALFDNPQGLLVPDMFVRVIAQAETRKGALLIPQRAVQHILDKTFVTVVGEGEKAESRPVKLGPQVGDLWVIVEEGLTANDVIVVDGAQKVQPGTPLQVNMISPDNI